jgi:hypothetical protein
VRPQTRAAAIVLVALIAIVLSAALLYAARPVPPATANASPSPTATATAATSSPLATPAKTNSPATTTVTCGTVVVNSITSGQGSGPNTYELLSPTGINVGRFFWDSGQPALGTYICARFIPGAPLVAFDSLIRPSEAGYVAQPTVATDSCGSVTAYAADGAHMLVTLTAGGVATQYDLQYQFIGGTAPTDIGTRLSAGTSQLLLITGRQVPPDSGSPNAVSLQQYNVARVSACTPTSSVNPRPGFVGPTGRISFIMPLGCAYIGQALVSSDQATFNFDCGAASRDARGTLAPALTQQGWTSCGAVTATATWANGTHRLIIAEGSGSFGDYPKLTQPARPAASSSCP